MKKVMLLFLLIIFFFSCHFAYAGLVINEVMYDLSGSDSTNTKSREWIEIYNNGVSDVSIDASTWRIYDGGANRTINGENNFTIPALGFIIFAGDKDTFLIDHPGFLGVVYDTGITSLNNSGATLKILDQNGNALDTLVYTSTQGGAGDGNTLQKISGTFSGAVQTPGVTNETTPPPAPSSSNSLSNTNSSTSSTNTSGGTDQDISISSSKKEQKIKTQILTKNFIFTGVPVEFKANTFGYSGEPLFYGKYFWNFGDGGFKEIRVNEVEKFSHIYFYPGEYTVSLEYYMNYNFESPDAVDKITIKVIAPDIIISNIGDDKDFFIEITNNTNYDADISKWIIGSDNKSFIIPRNTILGPKKKIVISPQITNLSVLDKDSLKLLNPQRDIVYDYMASSVVVQNEIVNNINKTDKIISKKEVKIPDIVEESLKTDIHLDDLVASPVLSGTDEGSSNSYFFLAIFVVFLGIASSIVYFIRNQRSEMVVGDDFELLDE